MPVIKLSQLSEQVVTASGGTLTGVLDADFQDILNVDQLTVNTITVSGLNTGPLKIYGDVGGYGSVNNAILPTLSDLQDTGISIQGGTGLTTTSTYFDQFYPANYIISLQIEPGVLYESNTFP